MEKKTIYHDKEEIFDTYDSIINFFLKDERSNDMFFSSFVMKHFLKILNNENSTENIYISTEDFNIRTSKIKGGILKGDEKDLKANMNSNFFTFLLANINGKKIVLANLIVYPGEQWKKEDFHISLTYSDYARKVLEDIRISKETIKKFKL